MKRRGLLAKTAATTTLPPEQWLAENFPNVASAPMAKRHSALWRWFEGLKPGVRLSPRVEIWPRGGGKSTTIELGCAYVGAKLSRRFVLYVCGTQDQADKHVQAVSNLLQKLGYGPLLNKMGKSQGWRREQLRTDHGFNVAGIGLDVAVRGIKLDEYRPDLIIFDDIDGRNDTPTKTAKKERALTQDIMPAGSADVCIAFVQNLIIEHGIASKIVEGSADFLLDADVHGPEPAVFGLKVVDDTLENGRKYKRIVAGEPSWEGQNLDVCQSQIIREGWPSFKRERQHEVKGADGHFFDVGQLSIVKPHEIPNLLQLCRAWDLAATELGGDYTAGPLMGVAANGTYWVLDVKRHQFGSDKVRKLLRATAERDSRGEVWEADEFDDTGRLERAGEKHFEFRGKPSTRVPDDPGQAGTDQARQIKLMLSEFCDDVESVSPSGKKAVRARGFADAVNSGNVYLVEGDWNRAYIEELRQFREDEQHDFDDMVDGSSDAYNKLARPVTETKAARYVPPPSSQIATYQPI